MISDLVITYNGINITDYFDLTEEPIGRNTPNRQNTTQSFGNSNGSDFISGRFTEKIIGLPVYGNTNDLTLLKNTINGMINVDGPKPLTFSDRPNEVWYGIIDTDCSLVRSLDYRQEVSGNLNFLIPAGMAFAKDEKEFIANLNSDGVLMMEIENNGTETTELSFNATMTSDNGFLGVVGPLGAFEVGNAAEVDGHTYQRTDVVAKNHLRPSDEPNWELNSTKAKTYYPIAVSGIPNRFGEGSFNWTAGSEGPTPVFPNNSTECWVGPTLYRDIPVNSSGENTGNFEAMWRCNFKTASPKEMIREEFNLVNGDQVVAAIILRDSNNTKTEAKFELMCYTPDGTKYYQGGSIDLKKATGSWFDVRVSRVGSAITFRLTQIRKLGTNDNVAQYNWQYQKKFTVAEMADVPITGTTYWPHAKWNNAAVPKLNSKGESITNFVFRWINVDKWADDPNRYSADDVLHYDGTTGKFYVNQLLAMNDIIQGSVDLRIPPGTWYVEFYYSDFAETPTIVGKLRERWL